MEISAIESSRISPVVFAVCITLLSELSSGSNIVKLPESIRASSAA